MTLIVASVLGLNLVVFGLHVLAPFRFAHATERARALWSAAALPALVATGIATAAVLRLRPDEALAWGLLDPIRGSTPARLIALALAALLACDLLLAIGGRKLEPAGWRLAGVLGVLGATAHVLGSELLRTGSAPAPGALALLAGAALRLPLTLAAGELALGAPRFWAPLAGPSLLLATLAWTPGMWIGLGTIRWTLIAAALLLLASRFTPPRMRRASGFVGLVLAILALAHSAEVGRILGGSETIPDALLGP